MQDKKRPTTTILNTTNKYIIKKSLGKQLNNYLGKPEVKFRKVGQLQKSWSSGVAKKLYGRKLYHQQKNPFNSCLRFFVSCFS